MNPAHLKALRCPICHGELTEQTNGLLCPKDALIFPVRDGMPIMLIEQAIPAAGAASDA